MDVGVFFWSAPVILGQQAFEAAKKEGTYWEMKRGQEVIVLRLGAKRALFGFTQMIKVAMLTGNDSSKEEVKDKEDGW